MKTIHVSHDKHVHRLHEGLKLTLVKVTAPRFTGEENFISGVCLEDMTGINKGMFSEYSQPIQYLDQDSEGEYTVFTMSCCTSISSEQLKTLKEKGEIDLGSELFPIHIEIL